MLCDVVQELKKSIDSMQKAMENNNGPSRSPMSVGIKKISPIPPASLTLTSSAPTSPAPTQSANHREAELVNLSPLSNSFDNDLDKVSSLYTTVEYLS